MSWYKQEQRILRKEQIMPSNEKDDATNIVWRAFSDSIYGESHSDREDENYREGYVRGFEIGYEKCKEMNDSDNRARNKSRVVG